MSSTIATVRPVAVGYKGANGWTLSPSGTLFGVTSDDNDVTFASPPAGNSESIELALNMATFALPALAQLQWIQVRARVKSAALTNTVVAKIETIHVSGWPEWNDGTLTSTVPAGTISTLLGPQWTTKTEDVRGAFTAADLNNMAVGIWPARSADLTVYELYLDIAYNQAPVVSVATVPVTPITTTSIPTVTHTYTDPEGDPQERYRRKVYIAPGGGWPGDFNPDTNQGTGTGVLTPVWDSTVIYSVNQQDPVGTRLHNNNYRAYVKAADQGSKSRYSAWAFTDFVINVPPPPPPTMVLAPLTATARVQISLTPGVGVATSSYHLQRSDDGQVTWRDTRGMSNPTIVNTQGAGTTVLFDTECPREKLVWYRVRPTNTGTFDVTAPYGAPQSTRLNSDNQVWVHSSGDPTLDMAVVMQGPDITGNAHEEQATYWPEGRGDPVVIGGTIHTEVFGIAGRTTSTGTSVRWIFAFKNDVDWQQFIRIRNRQEPICVQTLYGDSVAGLEQFWVRLGGDMSTVRLGGSYVLDKTAQVRKIEMDAVVVARPA